MMKKKTENKYAILKQLLVLPLLAVLVMGLSNREVKTEVIQKENQLESKLESNQIKSDSLKMNNKEFMSQLYHDGLFELQDYGEGAPLIFLNGKEVIEKVIFDESDFKTSQILPPKEAVERFGERGNNGAMIFETKTNYLQKEAIKGKVTNEKGEPLVGASVIIKGNTVGTITDTKGNYEIKSEGEIETLLFGKDGYEMMEVKTNGRKNIDVKLEVDNKLYIVDGKEYEGKTGEIDPDNIGRIDILKGESGFKLYGDKGKNGVVLIFTKSTNNQGDPIFYKVDTLPEFPGGELALRTFLDENINYPEIARKNGISGKVYVTFIIDKKGKVNDAKITRGLDPALDKEAVRVVSSFPDWKPGKQRGQAVNVSYTVPVDFVIKEPYQNTKSVVSIPNREDVLFIVDGKEYKGEINKIDQNSIAEMNVLKDETATKKYGEKGKNGVLEITLKNGNENTKITSQLEFRKFIAEKIKYPVEAVETNTHGNISFFFRIDDNGKIFDIKRPNKGDISLEEIVVVSSKTEIPGRYIKNADNKILTNEIERVLESTPLIEIPEYKGKTIKINVKFELQETTDKQTILELRSAIAQNIKYPVLAQENNQQGVVEVWASIAKDGTISRVTDKRPDGKFINVDEVVVTALKSEKTVTSEKSKDLDLLVKESKRVIEQLSPLKIPELAGETVSFRIKFVLQ